MERSIRLPLYGDIDHQEKDNLSWDLYQTKALARLRDISLSSLPTRFAPHGSAASRFAHSVGVGYLARQLVANNPDLEKMRQTLISAALLHDIGSPPFSHIAEIFMFGKSGRTHERQTEVLLAQGEELDLTLASYNVSSNDVLNLILGKGIFGPLIAGSIDLDNIDNSLHLLTSIGSSAKPSYDPRRLVKAFVVNQNGISLQSKYADQLLGWDAVRTKLYGLLQREEQLSSSTMLYRAMEFASVGNYLPDDFWQWEEGRALAHLRYHSGSASASLLDNLNRWQQYNLSYSHDLVEEDPRLAAIYDNWPARYQLANRLCDEIGVPHEEMALYLGKDRGAKKIALPFVGERSHEVASLFFKQTGQQRLQVYMPKKNKLAEDKIKPALDYLISQLKEGPRGHAFF